MTKGRRPTYFKSKKSLPKKYQTQQYIMKKGKLFDTESKKFVIANAGVINEARFKSINGNEIYARMHEQQRVKIINTLKDHMKQHIRRAASITEEPLADPMFKNPVAVRMVLCTQFGAANWDADNLWLYHKCFLDCLTDMGIIRNDNVLHVRDAGRTTFIPIKDDETPTLEFNIEELEFKYPTESMTLITARDIEPGEAPIDPHLRHIYLGIGRKKIIFGAAKKAIRRAMYYCLNNHFTAMVDEDVFNAYSNFFECFAEHRVQLIKTKQAL